MKLRLVYGASGYIGTNLVEHLCASGYRVRAAARRSDVLAARGWSGVECVRSDVVAGQGLAPALDAVDTAYYLVHSMAAGSNFGALDLQAAENFAQAAAAAGVRRIVYLGGLVPDDAASEHIVSRRDTGEILRRGAVPVTELRAGIIVGPGSAAFEVMRDLVFHLPVMLTPRWVRASSPPIALADLLTYLEVLPGHDEAAGKVYDAAGPESLTYEEMMLALADVAGRRRPLIIPVPVLSPRLSSYWLRFITAVPTPVARALVEGLKHDFSAQPGPLRALVPQELMDFRASVAAAFEAERRATVSTRWTEGAFAFRGRRPDHAYYAKRAAGSAETELAPGKLWSELQRIGGGRRYYYLNALWWLREVLDWLVGGTGLHHGRRHPSKLRVGDRVDSWEVIGLAPERRLTLAFGMRAPGSGVLEFEIEPRTNGGSRLTATAYWHPAGVWGILYWMILVPVHKLLFEGMTSAICRAAEARSVATVVTD